MSPYKFAKIYIWLITCLTGNTNLNIVMGRTRVKNKSINKNIHKYVGNDNITGFNVSNTMKNTSIIYQNNETIDSNSNHSERLIQLENSTSILSQHNNISENALTPTFNETTSPYESSLTSPRQSISPSMPTRAPQKYMKGLPSSMSMNGTDLIQALENLNHFTNAPQVSPSSSSITFEPTLSENSQMMAVLASLSPHSMYTNHPTSTELLSKQRNHNELTKEPHEKYSNQPTVQQNEYSYSPSITKGQNLTQNTSPVSLSNFPTNMNITNTSAKLLNLTSIIPSISPTYLSNDTVNSSSNNITNRNESLNGINAKFTEIPTISPYESLQPSSPAVLHNDKFSNSPSNSTFTVNISESYQSPTNENSNQRNREHINNNSYFPTFMPSISKESSNTADSPSATGSNMFTLAPTTLETTINQTINDTSMSSTLNENPITDDSFMISRTMTTTYEGTNMTNGFMFDIQTLDEIKITGLDIHTNSTNEVTYEIYTRNGTHKNFEEIPQSWKPIASGRIEGQGVSHVTTIPSNKLESFIIPSNTTQSFYITLTTPELLYSEGTKIGSSYLMNSDMILMEGVIIDNYPFGIDIASPCIWNGAIHYQAKQNDTYNIISNIPSIYYLTNTPSISPNITSSSSPSSTIQEIEDEPSIFFSGLFVKYPSSSNFFPDIKNNIDSFILNTLNSIEVQKNLDMEAFFEDVKISNVNSIPVDIDDNDGRCPISEDDINLKCGAINIYVEVLHSDQISMNDISRSLTPFIKLVAKEMEYDASYIEPVNENLEVMITLEYVNRQVFGGVEISLFENILLDFLSKPFSIGLLPYKVKDVQVYGDGLAPIILKPEEESLFSPDETWYKFRLDTLITTTYYILHNEMDLGNLVIKSLTFDNEAFIERLQENFQFESVKKIQAHFMVGSPKDNSLKKILGTIGILVLLVIAYFVKFNPMKNKSKKRQMYSKAVSFEDEDSVKINDEDNKNKEDEDDDEDEDYSTSLNSKDKTKSWVSLRRKEPRKNNNTFDDDGSVSNSYISTGTYDENVTWKQGLQLPDVS